MVVVATPLWGVWRGWHWTAHSAVATAEWLKFFMELAELVGADKGHVRKPEYQHAPAAASQFRLEKYSHQEPHSIAPAADPGSFATGLWSGNRHTSCSPSQSAPVPEPDGRPR